MAKAGIGEQEMALLRYVADRGGVSVGEVAEQFGVARGLARSTVLTMMERLRMKGFLSRRQVDGVYQYRARQSSADLLKDAVERFVHGSLDGSVSPFLAYLSENPDLSDDDVRELERIVGRLSTKRRKDR